MLGDSSKCFGIGGKTFILILVGTRGNISIESFTALEINHHQTKSL